MHTHRAKIDQLPESERHLAALKAVYTLNQTYPMLTDWVLQDAKPGAFAFVLSTQADAVEARLLQQFGVSDLPAVSAARMSEYVAHCIERREQRLRPVLDKWAPFAFTETHSNYATFIGYTEGLSDARFERFFKAGSRLSVLNSALFSFFADCGSVFMRL